MPMLKAEDREKNEACGLILNFELLHQVAHYTKKKKNLKKNYPETISKHSEANFRAMHDNDWYVHN